MIVPGFYWQTLSAALLVLLSASGLASAQGAMVPHGSLFGASGSAAARQQVDFTLSLAGAHDSDTPVELAGVGGAETFVSGWSTMLNADGGYHWTGKRFQAGATGSSALRYYGQTSELRNAGQAASVTLGGRLADRTRIQASQTLTYSPSYLYGLFASAPPAPGEVPVDAAPDYAVADAASTAYGSTVTLSQGLGRRSQLSGGADWQSTDFQESSSAQTDLTSRGINVTYSHGTSRNMSLRFAYRYRTGTFGAPLASDANPTRDSSEQGLEGGINYTRPLSASRRIVFSASLGSSSVRGEGLVPGGRGNDRYTRASTDLSVGYQFKTWQTHATFQRGVEYVAALGQPVFVNGVSLEWTALPTARLDLSAGARYSTGVSALSQGSSTADTYTASGRARYAINQALAAYGEYVYYFYELRGAWLIGPGFPRGLDRNGIRFGLTLWVPVLRR